MLFSFVRIAFFTNCCVRVGSALRFSSGEYVYKRGFDNARKVDAAVRIERLVFDGDGRPFYVIREFVNFDKRPVFSAVDLKKQRFSRFIKDFS